LQLHDTIKSNMQLWTSLLPNTDTCNWEVGDQIPC